MTARASPRKLYIRAYSVTLDRETFDDAIERVVKHTANVKEKKKVTLDDPRTFRVSQSITNPDVSFVEISIRVWFFISTFIRS